MTAYLAHIISGPKHETKRVPIEAPGETEAMRAAQRLVRNGGSLAGVTAAPNERAER
jgi:hypothetical protein